MRDDVGSADVLDAVICRGLDILTGALALAALAALVGSDGAWFLTFLFFAGAALAARESYARSAATPPPEHQ